MTAPANLKENIIIDNLENFSREIQGLRAVAVISVIFFHLWPTLLPGGYVGVDIFFVISGYLITNHLLNSKEKSKKSFLIEFYIRRVTRLLPAALTVLVITLLAFFIIFPSTRWDNHIKETLASIFYIENWMLISTKLDYLNADSFLSPIQHFWSLSVEEQFYLFWPLLFVISIYNRNYKPTIYILIISFTLLSFSLSIYLTDTDPQISYLNSLTRFWELSAGGILALFLREKNFKFLIYKNFLFIGLMGIFYAIFFFGPNTRFPGSMAFIPVISTIAIIMGIRHSSDTIAHTILSNPFFVHIGNISYSLYLWHWPLIIFSNEIFSQLTNVHKTIIILISYVFSFITKKYIEDKFRFNNRFVYFKASILSSILLAFICGCFLFFCTRQNPYLSTASLAKNPGALIFEEKDTKMQFDFDFQPSLAFAKNDIASVYKDGCHSNEDEIDAKTCIYGNKESKISLLIVGDSHAAQWIPALQEIAEKRKWKLISITKSSCAFTGKTIYLRNRVYAECDEWYKSTLKKIIEINPAVVIATNYVGHLAYGANNIEESDKILSDGLIETWLTLINNEIDVVVIKDSPKIGIEIPDCVAKNMDKVEKCFVERKVAFSRSDPLVMAAKAVTKIKLIDLNNKICRENVCRPIEGNVLVYRDGNHLTATYVRSLSYFIDAELINLNSLKN